MAMKTPLSVFLVTVFSTLPLSHQAYANRPAMDDMTATNNETEEAIADTQPEVMSSVEMIMQQETQQPGDVLQLPPQEIQPGDVIKVKLLDFPRRGMTMDKVQNEYGAPANKTDSVGEPPITRWIYDDRVVYFEYSTVLHVVAR